MISTGVRRKISPVACPELLGDVGVLRLLSACLYAGWWGLGAVGEAVNGQHHSGAFGPHGLQLHLVAVIARSARSPMPDNRRRCRR